MNIAKHMEAIALITIALACIATYAAAAIPAAHDAPAVSSEAIPTVTIIGKRLSATEKARFVL